MHTGAWHLPGISEQFEIDFKPLNMWLKVAVFSPKKGFFVAMFDNITERKQVEIALQESEIKFREIFNSANDAIHLHEIDERGLPGRLIDVNDVACRMVQYTKEEMLEKSPLDLTTEYHSRPLEEIGGDIITKGVAIFETRYLRKDGSIVPVEVNAHVVVIQGKKLVLSIIRDLSRRKAAEEALQAANKKLTLLSSITRHDIKNQLMALNSYIELSKDAVENPVELKNYMDKEQKIADTINRQISFTQDYEGLGVKSAAWQDISALVRDAATSLPMKDIGLNIQCYGLEVFADPLLQKVFYNLIDNSLHYGGDTMTSIHVSMNCHGKDLQIIFEDDGTGISNEDKKQLFTKGFGKHTGLGLFLCREILSITGITIIENGETGKGARFEITVPGGGIPVHRAMRENVPEIAMRPVPIWCSATGSVTLLPDCPVKKSVPIYPLILQNKPKLSPHIIPINGP